MRRVYAAAIRHIPRSAIEKWDLAKRRRLLRDFARGKYDLIWAVDYYNLELGMPVADKLGVPLVYETIDLVPEYEHLGPEFSRNALDTERALICRASGMLTSCESYADYYQERYGALQGFRRPVVHDNAPAGFTDSPSPVHEPIRFLFLGALTFNRPIQELMEACAQAKGDFTFTFQGPNYLGDQPRQAIADLGLEGRVILKDACSGSDLVEVARDYDIGIVALRGRNENERRASTSKLFTYMASGLAILGSDLPGIASVVQREGNGILIAEMTPLAWGRAIEDICGLEKDQIMTYKYKSLEAAYSYDWDHQKSAFLQVMSDALRKPIAKSEQGSNTPFTGAEVDE